MSWYLKVLQNYVTFSGRARRKEYWMFFLINVIIVGVLFALAGSTEVQAFYYLYLLYILGTALPSLAVVVRRLHDIGKSGWWVFITLIPIIGSFWLLILMVTEGQGDNQYGPSPKALTA
ncbi:DUF805 domain-containing protein [Catellatospora sp. KI3]|uniref:DUF805 domain-containing protein n=1 Tax=Catellatospora sp. KI3 TaxID=3041620 RepID=UPI0024827971|nr:DUF805 domain-containing protein [Catellatospora sp. KI3]MDI1460007.1 DUF805 domain-containing protein [Catellatospora sp. KI3]